VLLSPSQTAASAVSEAPNLTVFPYTPHKILNHTYTYMSELNKATGKKVGHPENFPDWGLVLLTDKATYHTPSLQHAVSIDHLCLDDGVAAIERGLALFIPPMATAAFAAL